jgi:hypothetical protein
MSSSDPLADVASNMQCTTVELAMGLRQILYPLTLASDSHLQCRWQNVIKTHEHARDFKKS